MAGEIIIKIYNLYGFEDVIKIPFTVFQTSSQHQGIELKLVTANISNDKRVSYIFNNITENQLILAQRENTR